MYLTGDLARIEPGGPVYCLGRADEAGEKFAASAWNLMKSPQLSAAQPGVASAAVTNAKTGGHGPACWFRGSHCGLQNKCGWWRQALSARLPAYMPAHFENSQRSAAPDFRQS